MSYNDTVLHKVNLEDIDKGKLISIKSIPVQHGNIESQSFIINKKCAYVSDANEIYKKGLKLRGT